MARRHRFIWLLAAPAVCSPALARAQAPSSQVTAEALFEDARKLMSDGKYADACPKFADSQRLDPSASTLLNLANCWEKLGRRATAWATYKEAASEASAAGRKDYLDAAQRHAEALAPKLSHITLSVSQAVPGLQVERDGVAVDPAEWQAAIPVDPGLHTIAAAAPGYRSWSSTAEIAATGGDVTVAVPALEAVPAPSPPAAPATAPKATPETTVPALAESPPGADRPRRAAGGTERAIGWVLGGAGVVGLGVGTALIVTAKTKYNTSLGQCEPNNQNLCNDLGVRERGQARTAGDGATLAYGLGAAAVVAGAVLLFTAPSGGDGGGSPAVSFALSPNEVGGSVRGTW